MLQRVWALGGDGVDSPPPDPEGLWEEEGRQRSIIIIITLCILMCLYQKQGPFLLGILQYIFFLIPKQYHPAICHTKHDSLLCSSRRLRGCKLTLNLVCVNYD